MTNAGKPLTFAAMLVRAQRRFDALGKPFPHIRHEPAAQAWPQVRMIAPSQRGAVAG